MQSCNQIYVNCLSQNSYPADVCEQPTEIPNPDCQIPVNDNGSEASGTSSGGTTTGGTTTGGTTTGGTTTGGTTTGGTTTGGTTTGGTATGGTTTGGTTTGGTATGGTTTGGTTTGGTATGGTTTGGTTTGGTATGGTTTGGTTSIGSWQSFSTSNSPTARRSHTATWTGSEMIVWGGYVTSSGNINTGGRYNPSTNIRNLVPNSISGTPSTRDGHTAVWTGTEVIIWGGYQDAQQTSYGFLSAGPTNTGSSYNPVTNSWNQTSISGAPIERYGHTAIWTGTKMLVWGGKILGSNSFTKTGGLYNPASFTWSSLSSSNESGAPTPRWQHTAVWTGTEMIVWGGLEDDGGTKTNSGARYNPSTDTWNALPTDGAPSARSGHTAIWTGSEMIIWGGNGRTGGKYNPSTNTWTSLANENTPFGKGHTTVWTGSKMIVWGGAESDGITLTYSNSGAEYDPITNAWTPISISSTPSARSSHTAIWTGTSMLIWGGGNQATGVFVNTGGKYNP